MVEKSKRTWLFVLIICIMLLNIFPSFVISDSVLPRQETTAFFTLSFDGSHIEYSLDDLETFPAITGEGGRLKVTGDVVGPYEYTGVSIMRLAEEFSSIPSRFEMVTISDDGYVFKYSYDDIRGNVEVFDEDGNSEGIGNVNMILAYAEDGDPLIHGGPLRIAFVNEEGVITDAFLWSKYVEEIEFVFDSSDTDPPSISIEKPENAIYYDDKKLVSYSQPIIIGDITFQLSVNDENRVANVMFIIGNDIESKQRNQPYRWNFDEKGIDRHTIKIVAYDESGNIGISQKDFLMFNFI